MITSKRDLIKRLGLTEEEAALPFKPVNPTEERIIDGLERLLEELAEEEKEDKEGEQGA
jgi:hypothetical protein